MSKELKAGFDISSLKGTDLSTIKDQNDEISKGNSKKRDYLSIEDGTNKFRFFPAHPDSDIGDDGKDKARYSQRKFVVWVKITGKEDKLVNRSFLNARVHASQEADLVEEYQKLATAHIKNSESLNTTDKATKLKNLSSFESGIKHQSKYLAYAIDVSKKIDEEGRRGLIEISDGIKKKLDAISLAEVEEDPTGSDIISCPTDGVTITIKKDPKKQPTERYSVAQGRKAVAIEREDADWWIEEDSLKDMLFGNVKYHKGTIDQLFEGIQNYDEDQEIGVADTDEFIDIYEALKEKLDDAPVYDDESPSVASASKEPKKERSPRKVLKTLGEMSKSELKEFIMDKDLDVRVLRNDTVEDILSAIETETELTSTNYPSDLSESDDTSSDDAFEDDEVEEVKEEKKSRRVRRER